MKNLRGLAWQYVTLDSALVDTCWESLNKVAIAKSTVNSVRSEFRGKWQEHIQPFIDEIHKLAFSRMAQIPDGGGSLRLAQSGTVPVRQDLHLLVFGKNDEHAITDPPG